MSEDNLPPIDPKDLIQKIMNLISSDETMSITQEISDHHKKLDDEFALRTFTGYSSDKKEVEATITSSSIISVVFNKELNSSEDSKQLLGILTCQALNNATEVYCKAMNDLYKIKVDYETSKIKEMESKFNKELNPQENEEANIPPPESNVWDITSYRKDKNTKKTD